MDLMIIVNGFVGLLTAACLGFLAYGAWLCLRHAARSDGVRNQASAVPDTDPYPLEERVHRVPLAHE